MAPLVYVGCRRKVLLLSVLLFLFVSVCFTSTSASSEPQLERKHSSTIFSGSKRRMLLKLEAEKEQEEEDQYEHPLKKKSTKNQTKLIKPTTNLSSKSQTKSTIKSSNNNNNLPSKNQTKLTNTGLLKKLNSTTLKTKKLNSTSKAFNSTKQQGNSVSTSTKIKSLDLTKASGGGGANTKNKTTKATATKDKIKLDQSTESKSEKPNKQSNNNNNNKKQSPPSSSNWWFEDEDGGDFVSDFKDLPVKFQKTLIPDLERISTTSKAYITKANKEITKGFKPYVGNKYAPTIAVLLSCACVLIPLLLVSLLFNKIKAYFSLQKLLIFIQAYISIYFSILCLSSLVTGLEPLRFFYSTSQSTYLCLQIIQTLAYVLYLLLLLMYLVLVFSTDCGLGSKFLGLAQTFVGFAVGLHYYMTVFHRVVLRQPPRTNWKIHGVYATCFFLICLLARADRRKKTYLEEGGEEGKKN